MSGIKINPECVSEFNDFKMGRSKFSYLTFAVSADLKEIKIERRGATEESWDSMIKSLPADAPRYIVTHYHWNQGLDGKRSRTVFIHWSPQNTALKSKMIYAASKQSFKQCLTGLQVDVQADGPAELTNERVLELCQRFNKA